MTQFLNWLFSAASKVYDWFGSSYYSLKNAAANAWAWAVSQAQSAYQSAVNYILSIQSIISNTIKNYVDWLLTKINDLREGVIEDIAAFTDWVEWKINQVDQQIENAVQNAVTSYNNLDVTFSGLIEDAIQNATNWLQTWVLNNFEWVLPLRNAIQNLLSLLTPDTLDDIFKRLEAWRQALDLFFQNPARFVFDVLQPKFLEYFAYLLAWALGTTIYDLTDTPTWKE